MECLVENNLINYSMNPDADRNRKKYCSQERGKHFWTAPFNCILCSVEKEFVKIHLSVCSPWPCL